MSFPFDVGQTPGGRRHTARPAVLLVLITALVAFVGAACAGDEEVEVTTTTTTTTATAGGDSTLDGPSDPDSEYCAVAAEIRDGGASAPEDADAALEQVDQIERLAAAAPPELSNALERYTDTFRQLAEVPEDDPAAFAEVLGLLIAPELREASADIDQYTRSACGFAFGDSEG